MELFKKIAEVLAQGEHLNISVAKTSGDRMTVYVTVNGDNLTEDVNNAIPPVLLKGTPDELDNGFLDAILTPVEEVVGLHVNWRQFNAAKDALAKDLASKAAQPKDEKKTPAAKKPSKSKKDVRSEETSVQEEATEIEQPAAAEEIPTQTQPADAAADMPDYSGNAGERPAEQEAPAQQQPVEEPQEAEAKAPEAENVVKEDLNTLWKKGRKLFDEGKYDAALEAYQQCRMVAPEKLYATIDKAIAVCNARIQKPLFNE